MNVPCMKRPDKICRLTEAQWGGRHGARYEVLPAALCGKLRKERKKGNTGNYGIRKEDREERRKLGYASAAPTKEKGRESTTISSLTLRGGKMLIPKRPVL